MSLEGLLRFAKNMLAPLGLASMTACSAVQSSVPLEEPDPIVSPGAYSPVLADWRAIFRSDDIVACMGQDSLLHCAVLLEWEEGEMYGYCGGSRPYCIDFQDGEMVDEVRAQDLMSQGVALIKVLDDAGRPTYSTLPIVRMYCTEKQYDEAIAQGDIEENVIFEMMRHSQFPY